MSSPSVVRYSGLATGEQGDGAEDFAGLGRKLVSQVERSDDGGDEGEGQDLKRDGTMASSVVNLVNSIIGSGVLGMPYAFAATGWYFGYSIIVLAAVVSIFSLHLLVECSKKVPAPSSFSKVTDASIPRLTFLVDFSVFLSCFGVGLSYLIVFGGLMPDVMDAFGTTKAWVNRELWVSIGFLIMAPLSCFKKLDPLKYTSSAAILFIVFVAIVLVTYAGSSSLQPCEDDGTECVGSKVLAKLDTQSMKVLGVFVFAYSCQMNIFPIVNEIKSPYTRGRLDAVVFISIGIAFVLYCIVAGSGYYIYGSEVESDILISFPNTPLTSVARVAVSLLVCFSYPVLANPGRNSLIELWGMTDQDKDMKYIHEDFRFIVVTTLFLFGTYGIALVVDDLGVVLDLIGATSSSIITFILPGAAYLTMYKEDGPWWKITCAHLLLGFGLLFMPTCLVFEFM